MNTLDEINVTAMTSISRSSFTEKIGEIIHAGLGLKRLAFSILIATLIFMLSL